MFCVQYSGGNMGTFVDSVTGDKGNQCSAENFDHLFASIRLLISVRAERLAGVSLEIILFVGNVKKLCKYFENIFPTC